MLSASAPVDVHKEILIVVDTPIAVSRGFGDEYHILEQLIENKVIAIEPLSQAAKETKDDGLRQYCDYLLKRIDSAKK